jgi:peroxiredoxin
MRAFTRAGLVLSLLFSCWLLPQAVSAAPLRDFSGHVRSIQDYAGKGKWLVVMIWASDCRVCNREVHNYVDFQTFDNNATVLGISMDGQGGLGQAKAFVKRHSVNFPNLIGEPEDVARLFMNITGMAWRGTPSFVIYNPEGKAVVGQVGAVPVRLIEQYIKSHSAKPGAGGASKPM